MRILKWALICAFVVFSNELLADTLQENLRAESSTALASAARDSGDAARGAILFADAKLACTSCHAIGASDLVGPDLTQWPKKVSDEYLVEALLRPSAGIREGFEQESIITTNGQSFSGRVIRETQESVLLRLTSDPAKMQRIQSVEIESRQQVRQSAMPDNLIDQLKNRDQFLDLLRYVMQLRQQRGTARVANARDAPLANDLQGQVLIEQHQCGVCHEDLRQDTGFAIREAPDLSWARGRIVHEYIESFIIAPAKTHPGTTMPDMLNGKSEADRKTIARDLTQFIVSLRDEDSESTDRQQKPAGRELSIEQAVDRGREIFHSVGCVACHAPQDENSSEHKLDDGVPLSHVDRKYTSDGLADFLEDPHAVRPRSGMPNMQLTHWEAIDVAAFLMRDSQAKKKNKYVLDPASITRGRLHFSEFGCVSCHVTVGGTNKATRKFDGTTNFESETGCLSDSAGDWPNYALSDKVISLMKSAANRKGSYSGDDNIKLTLARFNCVACHERDSWGGVDLNRDEYFQTTNPNLGPQGRIPPRLTGVGAKLNEKWLRQVLVSGRSIRPYMKTRMPQFGVGNVAHLVDLFHLEDKRSPMQHPGLKDEKETRLAGFELVGRDGLNCIACHTFRQKPAATMPGVDLTEMTERLQKDWFVRYLLSPQSLSPGTVMPSFWPDGKSTRKEILAGETDQQIEAIWHYLTDGRQARQPKGLVRERIELLATNEAVMLRRSWPDVGKRGIGVGYPSLVNQLYDAEQMRVANLWQGRFADPGGVWRSQGHGVAHPLERAQYRFNKGPDLDDADAPWVVGDDRPPQHHFRGYDLDAAQRPAFHYQFEAINVTDAMVDGIDTDSGEPYLRRTTTLRTEMPRKGVRFRVGSGKQIEQLGDSFVIGGKLHVRMLSAHSATLVDAKEGKDIQVDIDVSVGASEIVVEYRWSK